MRSVLAAVPAARRQHFAGDFARVRQPRPPLHPLLRHRQRSRTTAPRAAHERPRQWRCPSPSSPALQSVVVVLASRDRTPFAGPPTISRPPRRFSAVAATAPWRGTRIVVRSPQRSAPHSTQASIGFVDSFQYPPSVLRRIHRPTLSKSTDRNASPMEADVQRALFRGWYCCCRPCPRRVGHDSSPDVLQQPLEIGRRHDDLSRSGAQAVDGLRVR
jgi:hypothetical protein